MTALATEPILDLRPYQAEAIEALTTAWETGTIRPAVVLPTGTGKTVIFAHLARAWHQAIATDAKAGPRVVVLVHRDELVQQAVGKLHSVAPHLDIGVVKAERNDVNASVVVASVQTLGVAKRLDQMRDVGLVIVDECHHATAPTYRRVMSGLGCYDGRAVTAGFTATMRRSDGVALGDVWQEVVYERDIIWAIQNGYLCDVKGRALTVADFDLSGVRSTAGDYSERDLGEALEDSSAPDIIAKAYLEHAPTESGLIFTPTVATAELMAETMSAAGIPTEAVSGDMPASARRDTLARFARGDVQALANCMLLTEGYDEPRASLAIIARPTRSAVLYCQMVGRILRPYPGKERALVLDVAGAASRHSLVGLTTLAGANVLDDESLIEAVERELLLSPQASLDNFDMDEGDGLDVIELHASELRELDLFHGSRQQWLRTDAGWWFIPAGEWFVAIIPDERPGTWQVGWYDARRAGGGIIANDLDDLAYAMAHGERWIAGSSVEQLSARAANWRTKRPTKAQIAKAASVGATITSPDPWADPPTAGEVSDRIAQRIATNRIDDRVGSWLARRGRTQ